ncbi:hypothetical protein GF323_04265 [Candidatus Woesearchaeota archaeon]|nr:hypothetical protein [Candidatus Woesearchaeota archaeon]
MVKSSRLRKVILGIAIALVLVFFLGYGVNTFYEEPKYEDFCGDRTEMRLINTQAECEEKGGRWTENEPVKAIQPNQYICTRLSEDAEGNIRLDCRESGNEAAKGYCDIDYYCRQEYDAAREPHARVSFIILMVLGMVAIMIGSLLLKVESVGSGIMGGGVLTILYAAIRFWGSIPDYARLIVLGIALAVLIWLGYKKLKG